MAPEAQVANDQSNEFSQHREQPERTVDEQRNTGPSLFGRFLLFVGFPIAVGVLALYFSYLQTFKNADHEISLDQDFILPCFLGLAFIVVIGFQTGGFREKKLRPLVKWPKVRRVKKIVHRVKKKEE